MKTTEFIDQIGQYKKRLRITNIVWGGITCLLILIMFLNAKEAKKQQLVVISDQGRFTATRVASDIVYYFDVRNFSKSLVKDLYEYDLSTYSEDLKDAKGLMDIESFKKVEKSLSVSNVREVLSDKLVRINIDIDSIRVYENERPLRVACYLKQNIIRDYEIAKVNTIGLSFALNMTDKSDKNPFGMLATGLGYFNYAINSGQGFTDEQLEALKKQNMNRSAETMTNTVN